MAQELSGNQGPRVLLIDDEEAIRDLLVNHLSARGYAVTAVDAAEEGIVEAGETQFDAVVADIHLPGLSGIDLASFLLSQDPELPIVLMTGDRDEDLAREAMARGPVQYLLKPFEAVEVEAAVRTAMAGRGGPMAHDSKPAEAAGESAPVAPAEWLAFVDQESWAGPGHGGRVERIAAALLGQLEDPHPEIDHADMVLAARTHEVGRLSHPDADSAVIAMQSAELMTEAGFPRGAVRAVRHMHERWDGTGGPEGLSGSQIPTGGLILAVADALDHYVAAWLHAGLNPDNAVDRAIHLVTVQQDQTFSPAVVGALRDAIETIRSICAPPEPARADVTTASYVRALTDLPFQAA